MKKKTTVRKKRVTKRKKLKAKRGKAIAIAALAAMAIVVVAVIALRGGIGSVRGGTLTEGEWKIGSVSKKGRITYRFPVTEGEEYWVYMSDRKNFDVGVLNHVHWRARHSNGDYVIGDDMGYPIIDWKYQNQSSFTVWESMGNGTVSVEIVSDEGGDFAIAYTVGYKRLDSAWY